MVAGDPGDRAGQVAVIGLGNMGMPIAERLAATGHNVLGYDVSATARDQFVALTNAPLAETALDAARVADVTILVLPTSAIVEQMLLGDGVLAAMPPGSIVIDMGSSDPVSSRELALRAAKIGICFVDAPVSGGGFRGARAGTLTIIIGGREADVARCMPLFQDLGQTIRHVGPVGAGHALKAINNLLSAISLLASSEALELGLRFGLDPNLMLDVINASSGRSDSTERKLPQFVVTKSFDSGGAMGLMVKDMHNATALADRFELPLRLGRFATDLWDQAVADLDPSADYTEIAIWAAMDARRDGPPGGL